MSIKKIVIALCIIGLQIPVSGQNNLLTKYLPSNSSMIMSFNPVKLAQKVPGESFRQSFVYRAMMKTENSDLKAFLADPSVTGIDFNTDLMVTVVGDLESDKSGATVNIFGVLKNESAFAGTLRKLSKEDDSVYVYGTNRILYTGGAMTLAWNNEIFVFSTGNKKEFQEEMFGMYDDSTGEKDFDKKMAEFTLKVQKIQREQCFELLTPKPNNSFYTNTAYSSVMSDPGDIKIWNDGSTNPLLANMPMPLSNILSKILAFTGKNKTSVINFENGKITGKSHSYLDAEIADIYKKYPKEPLNTELTRRLPKGTLLGLFLTSINSGLVKEMIEQSGLNELLDSVKEKIPFDLSLLPSTFKNNMMVAVVKNDDLAADDPGAKMGGIELVLAMPIADITKFEKLKTAVSKVIDSLKKSEKEGKDEDVPEGVEKKQPFLKDFKPVIKNNDNLLVISLSENTATNFLNDPGTGTSPEWINDFTQYPMLMSLDMKAMISLMLKTTSGPGGEKDQKAKEILSAFDRLIITGGSYENGTLNSTMEFRFSNPEQNALKQLFDMINMGVEESEKAKMERKESNEVIVEEVKEEKKEVLPPPPPPPPKVEMKPAKKGKG